MAASPALDKLKAHLHLAIDLLIGGNSNQKATARKVLTEFLKREVARSQETNNPPEALQATQTLPDQGWVCFHCNERMVTHEAAKEHFGSASLAIPKCLMNKSEGNRILKTLEIVTKERDYLIEMLDVIHIIDTNDFITQPTKD